MRTAESLGMSGFRLKQDFLKQEGPELFTEHHPGMDVNSQVEIVFFTANSLFPSYIPKKHRSGMIFLLPGLGSKRKYFGKINTRSFC